MSNSQNVPCLNPTLCKVKSHKPGTVGKCMTPSGRRSKQKNIAFSPLAVTTPAMPNGEATNKKMELRSKSQDVNAAEGIAIARWAFSRNNDYTENGEGKASGIIALDNLAQNPDIDGGVLHYIATGESLIDTAKNDLRPINQNDRLKRIVDNPNVEARTLRVIARNGEQNLAQLANLRLAKVRSEKRVAFFQMVRDLFK